LATTGGAWTMTSGLTPNQARFEPSNLRNSENHYNPENFETIIGAGQALRVSGRVLFSEDETPAPRWSSFDVAFGDFRKQLAHLHQG